MSSGSQEKSASTPSDKVGGFIVLPDSEPPITNLEEAIAKIASLTEQNEQLQTDLSSTRNLARDFGHMLVEEFVSGERRGDELASANVRANLDDKTGLYKPTVFEKRVKAITSLNRREGDNTRIHGLILADIDGFSILNSMLTHIGNDKRCLLPFAEILHNEVGDAGLASRFGGDEFAVFLRDAPLLTTLGVAARIQHLANDITLPDEVFGRNHLGVSMGVVRFRQGESYDKAFYRANRFLIAAKKVRNQIVSEDTAWQDSES